MTLSRAVIPAKSWRFWKVRATPAPAAPKRLPAGSGHPAQQHRPLGRRVQAGEDVHEGALPRAVRADEAVDGPGAHGEVHPVHRLHAAEVPRRRPRTSRSGASSARALGSTSSRGAGGGQRRAARSGTAARGTCDANPMSPSGSPTTTEKSIRAKIALRQSSVFCDEEARPRRAGPSPTIGASAWNGRVVLRARARGPPASERQPSPMHGEDLEERSGSRGGSGGARRASRRRRRPTGSCARRGPRRAAG